MTSMQDNPNKVNWNIGFGNYTPETFPLNDFIIRNAAAVLTDVCHGLSVTCGWHNDPKTGEPIERNVGEMICLMHSELSEAMEGHRKGLMDEKLPHRLNVEVEMADAVIRIFDFAGKHGLDLGGAIYDKCKFNAVRPDHKPENRRKEGGKAY